MSIRNSRGALATLLCVTSLAILALLIAVPSTSESIKQVAYVVMPILWVAGALTLTPFAASDGRGLATVAGISYAVAFLLPAATVVNDAGTGTEGVVWGFQAFDFGLLVVPSAWLANPAFVIALELRRRGPPAATLLASIPAFLLASTAALLLGTDIRVSVGFVVWAAAPAILTFAMIPRRRSSRTTRRVATP